MHTPITMIVMVSASNPSSDTGTSSAAASRNQTQSYTYMQKAYTVEPLLMASLTKDQRL